MAFLNLPLVIAALLLGFAGLVPVPAQAQAQAQINYFGAAFSPFVKGRGSDGQYPAWSSYSIDEVKQMLNIALTQHNMISTYGMEISWSTDPSWFQADSNGIVARAAAEINKARNSGVLSVSLGVYQQEDPAVLAKQIEDAFAAAQAANELWPGTVWGLTLTSEYIRDPTAGQIVLAMILANKARAQALGLKLGPRTEQCGQIFGGEVQTILSSIARQADFIQCNIYPGTGVGLTTVSAAVQNVNDLYFSARDGLWGINPALEVMIGETGWPSEGKSFNEARANSLSHLVEYWKGIKGWAESNKVKVHMFEAFDNPWRGDSGVLVDNEGDGEAHYGWWSRPDNSRAVYVEKATGREFE